MLTVMLWQNKRYWITGYKTGVLERE